MYGVPEDMDWSFLSDRELLQVGIGVHQASLKFDCDTSINIECDFDHLRSNMTRPATSAFPAKAATLVSLLGAKIANVVRQDGSCLVVEFDNNEILKLYDTNEAFESFQVVGPGKEIIV
jgi:hypothetical protein